MAESRMEQMRFIPESRRITGKSSSRAWLREKVEDFGNTVQITPEKHLDSFNSISGIEIQSRRETEQIASSEVAKKIRPGLPGLNVKVDLKLEDLHVFKKGNVYVICKDLSVAKKHFGNDYREERVNFTKVNEALKGGTYQVDINPSQFSTFLKGSEARVTPNEKFTDEHQEEDWKPIKPDFSKYFAKPPSDSKKDKEEPEKAIIDFSDDPSWKEYRKSVKDNEASVAFGRFLANAGGEDMEKLLDDFDNLDEAFGAKLYDGIGDSAEKYINEYKKINDYLQEFKNEVSYDKVYSDDMNSLVKNAKKSLESMRESLLEKGFELFIDTGEGKEIGSFYENRHDSYSKGSKEAWEEIDRRDYHYRDFEASRDEFLTYHFKPNEGIAKGGDKLIASMEEKLKKSVKLCKWEAELYDRNIEEGDFRPQLNDGQDEQFEKFLKSEEGISTKKLLAEIDYLEQKKPWEGNLGNSDGDAYETIKNEFKVDLEKFLNNYKSELATADKQAAINDLQRKLYSAQNKLYDKHLEKILERDLDEEKVTKLKETWNELLKDQSLVSRPEVLKSLTRGKNYREQSIKCFYAEREIVRASLEEENIGGYAKELEDFLEARNELVREGITKAKYPDQEMWKLVGNYENILKNDELHGELEASLDDVIGMTKGKAKDEIKGFLQDIQGMHENIPKELYHNTAFRKEYNKEITSFIDSINELKDNPDKQASANDIHQKANDIRNFLHKKMFGEFVKNYQGQDYVALNNMYSSYVTALSNDGWDEVAAATDTSMSACHSKEFELLKAKDEQTIKEDFSKMAEDAKASLEFAMREGKEEVDGAALLSTVGAKEKKRIEKLNDLLKESQELLDRIKVTV